MDIGTGKITSEEMKDVPHHLLDVATLDMKFSAGRFSQLAEEKIEEVRSRRRIPLIVGGTGLYLRALLKGLLPTPARSGVLRKRIERWESKEGLKSLHGFLRRIDPEEAGLINPNDRQRIYRAIEIYLVTGRPPTHHKKRHGFGEDKYFEGFGFFN